MEFTITTPAENAITINETTQTVNVSADTTTITVQTDGVITKAFKDLTDVTPTTYTQGQLVFVDGNLKLKAGSLVQTVNSSYRPIFEYVNSGVGTSSSIVLRKNYTTSTAVAGDGVGMRFEISDVTRTGLEYAYLHVQYDPTSPSFILSTTNDDGATITTALKANKDLVTLTGDLRINGNTIYDSTGARAIDFVTSSDGYPVVKFDTDRPYGLTASNFVIDSRVEMNTTILTTTSTTTTVLDSYNAATTRSGKYIIQISCGNDHQTWEGMVIHDGTTAKISAYGDLRTNGANLATITAAINTATNRLELKVTPTSSTSTRFRAMKTLIYV